MCDSTNGVQLSKLCQRLLNINTADSNHNVEQKLSAYNGKLPSQGSLGAGKMMDIKVYSPYEHNNNK